MKERKMRPVEEWPDWALVWVKVAILWCAAWGIIGVGWVIGITVRLIMGA